MTAGASRGVRAGVVALAVLLPLLSLVPALGGYLAASPPERVFLGFRILPEDHYQYGSFIAQARTEGRLAMENRLTTEPQRGRFVLLYLWLAGVTARATGLPDAVAWLALQFVVGVTFLLATWLALGRLLSSPAERLVAYLLAALASGLDWIPWALGATSLDRTFREHWNWSTSGSLVLPQWVAAHLVLLALVVALAERGRAWRLVVALAPFVAWLVHPYTGMAAVATVALVPVVAALSGLLATRRLEPAVLRDGLLRAAPALVSLALVAALAAWTSADPVYAATSRHLLEWKARATLPGFLLGYGLLLVPASLGLRALVRESGPRAHVVVAWTLGVLALSLNPWIAGIKFQFLLHLPLCILAARGVTVLAHGRTWLTARVRLAALAFMAVGTLLWPWRGWSETPAQPSLFASEDELACYDFLRAQPPGIVACAFEHGPRVAWLGEHPVHAGHWFLTLDPQRKNEEVSRLLAPQVPLSWKMGFLRAQRVAWILVSPDDRAAGLDPASLGDIAFARGGWTVVRVRP